MSRSCFATMRPTTASCFSVLLMASRSELPPLGKTSILTVLSVVSRCSSFFSTRSMVWGSSPRVLPISTALVSMGHIL